MDPENNIPQEVIKSYDSEGLKIDKNRVLTYSQLSCPLECTYCFVDDMSTNQKRNVAYLTQKQVELLKNLPQEINLIMLGCDTEFFQNKQQAIEILKQLATLGKDISMITKIPVAESLLDDLVRINTEMKDRDSFLSLSISLPCISDEMSKKYEPKVPSPERRIETVKLISEKEISTMLAIRPLLPDVRNEELEQIVDLTKDFVGGYYSGPLYLNDNRIEKLLPQTVVDEEAKQPHWMLDGNLFKEVSRAGQMEYLRKIIEEKGQRFFEGAAQGMEFLKKNK